MNEIIFLIIGIYIVAHIPAFILLALGLSKHKRNPKLSKTYLICAAIYFLIGGGICASLF